MKFLARPVINGLAPTKVTPVKMYHLSLLGWSQETAQAGQNPPSHITMLKENNMSNDTFFSHLVFTDEVNVHAGDLSRGAWQSPEDRVPKGRSHHPTKVML